MTGRTPLWHGPGVALLAWAVHFAIIYALVTFACDRRAFGWVATAACAAVALAVLLRARRSTSMPRDGNGDPDTRDLGRDVAAVTALLALIAILWDGLAVLSQPTCWQESYVFSCAAEMSARPIGRPLHRDIADREDADHLAVLLHGKAV